MSLLLSTVEASTAIAFPDLGLKPTVFTIGWFQLRWYSIAYLAGIFIGYWYLLKLIAQPGAPMARRHADDLVFYAALGIILWALHRRKAGAQAWGRSTADLNRRALVALDDVVAQGSVVTGKIEALASEARALESSAPDDPSRAAAANVRARLDELASTMQSDRALRLSSPPPTDAQLTYSTAVIRQQAQQLQGVLRPPAAADAALS